MGNNLGGESDCEPWAKAFWQNFTFVLDFHCSRRAKNPTRAMSCRCCLALLAEMASSSWPAQISFISWMMHFVVLAVSICTFPCCPLTTTRGTQSVGHHADLSNTRVSFCKLVPTMQRLRFLHEEIFGLFKMKGWRLKIA